MEAFFYMDLLVVESRALNIKAQSMGRMLALNLMGRMGTEAEMGLAALFLAADATFCTGIDMLMSGGAELNYAFKSQIPSS